MKFKDDSSQYFNVALASSVVFFGFDGQNLKILIHPRSSEPFKGGLILPSTYVHPQKSVEECIRELAEEKLGIHEVKNTFHIDKDTTYIEQLKAFSKVFRSPLGRVVNVAFFALVKLDDHLIKLNESNGNLWVDYDNIPDLAFDHNEIVDFAKTRLMRRVRRRPVGFDLLADEFTILQLQTLYEKALDKPLDKRNFRKKIFSSTLVVDTGKLTTPESARKVSKLYRFDMEQYEKMTLKGYDILF